MHEVETACFLKIKHHGLMKIKKHTYRWKTFPWWHRSSWINFFPNQCSILRNDVNSVFYPCPVDIEAVSVTRVLASCDTPTLMICLAFSYLLIYALTSSVGNITVVKYYTVFVCEKFISVKWQTSASLERLI